MRWIKEHKLISALIAIVLALVIIFVVSVFASGNSENAAGGPLNRGTAWLSGGLSSAADSIRDNITGLFAYKALQEQIEALEEENAELQKKLVEIQLDREDLEQLRELSEVLNFEYTSKEFDMVSADVISMDGANWTDIFTIDAGTESGIEIGDPVVNGMGLVGRIYDTGEGWSKVVSVIDEDSRVSFKLERDRKQLGIVYGNENGTISGYMMDADSTVAEGDVIITSGMGTFPSGLLIGNVKTVVYNSNTLLKEITVEPVVNFSGIEKVAVIR